MPTGGYDRRTRVTKRDEGVLYNPQTGELQLRTTGHRKYEEVISYRDNPTGELVLEKDIDPYGYFIKSNMTRKRDDARSKRNINEDEFSDSSFVDTGHPFYKVTVENKTSLNTRRTYTYGTTASATRSGAPFTCQGAEISALASARMPFAFKGTSSAYRRTFGMTRASGPVHPVDNGLEEAGRMAIKILAPHRPKVSVARSIGELAQRLPTIVSRGNLPSVYDPVGWLSRGGSEWLNLMFGINPTIQDAVEIGKVLSDLTDRLFQLRKDEGRIVRRRMEFLREEPKDEIFSGFDIVNHGTVTAGNNNLSYLPVVPATSSSTQRLRPNSIDSVVRLRESTRTSFSGAFSYYIPVTPKFAGNVGKYLAEFDKLVGLQATKSVIWQLTGFSWLVDWFIDIKSSLDLADIAFDDNLVINYGYAMRTTVRQAEQQTELTYTGSRVGPKYVGSSSTVVVKQRIRANPYGFIGSGAGEWNPLRGAILSALGLSLLR